jgi:hypothetical protein
MNTPSTRGMLKTLCIEENPNEEKKSFDNKKKMSVSYQIKNYLNCRIITWKKNKEL